MRAKKLVLMGVTGVAASLPVAASANLVADGTFTGALTGVTLDGPGYTEVGAGGSIGGDWAVTSGSVDVIESYWQAPLGTGNSVDMAGIQNGAIAQTTINSPDAGIYMLSFYMSGNPDGPPPAKVLGVSVNGGTAVDYTYNTVTEDNSHSDMKYILETEVVNLNGGVNTLSFADLSGPAGGSWGNTTPFGAVIGDVSLVPVPEAGTLAAGTLMLLPLGISALRIARKSRIA